MNLTRRHFLELAATGIIASCMVSCSPGDGREPSSAGGVCQSTFFAFDTACVIGGVMDQALLDDAVAYCSGFEGLLSRTIPDSDVSHVNGAHGSPVEVGPSTAELIGSSLRYSEESGGLFDITIGAVSSLWDFSSGIVPDAASIEAALEHVGYRMVEVEGQIVRLADPSGQIDLGGIAKGYIADKTASFLVENGVSSAFLNLGGNVKVIGGKEDGSPWSIGVRDPDSPDADDVVARVSSLGGSLVTSGLYERQFERDGKRYWHILDPRTGYPVQSSVVSASVYSELSIDGDGLTKPLFMLPAEDALSFIEAKEGIECLLVLDDGSQMQTSGGLFSRV